MGLHTGIIIREKGQSAIIIFLKSTDIALEHKQHLQTLFIIPNMEKLHVRIVRSYPFEMKISKMTRHLPFFSSTNPHMAWMFVNLKYL